jgi:acyl carrier protein
MKENAMQNDAVLTQPEIPEIAEWLTHQVADYLSMEPADVEADVPLAEYGLDSVFALGICGDIEERFDITVEPTLAWDYPTVGLIAEFVHSEIAAAR